MKIAVVTVRTKERVAIAMFLSEELDQERSEMAMRDSVLAVKQKYPDDEIQDSQIAYVPETILEQWVTYRFANADLEQLVKI